MLFMLLWDLIFFLMINSVDPDNIAFVEACSIIIWAILGCFLALFLFLIQLQNVFVLLIILTFLPSQRLLLRVYLCHSCIHNNFMERFHYISLRLLLDLSMVLYRWAMVLFPTLCLASEVRRCFKFCLLYTSDCHDSEVAV